MALSWIALCLAILSGVFVAVCSYTHLSCWAFRVSLESDGWTETAYYMQLHWIGFGMESDQQFMSSRLARELGRPTPTRTGWDVAWWRGTPMHRVSGSPRPQVVEEIHGIPWVYWSHSQYYPESHFEDGSRRSTTAYHDVAIAVWPLELLLLAMALPAGWKVFRWCWRKADRAISWVARTVERLGGGRPLGVCPKCGYDLRATPERCPECGHVVQRRAPQ